MRARALAWLDVWLTADSIDFLPLGARFGLAGRPAGRLGSCLHFSNDSYIFVLKSDACARLGLAGRLAGRQGS